MKAITIWQPWASLIACGAKKYETRGWPTKYRGPIAIHAAAKDPRTLPQEAGNMAKVAYSAEQAREIIRNYLSRADGFDLVNCEEALKISGACEGVPEEVFPAAPCKTCGFYKTNKKGE